MKHAYRDLAARRLDEISGLVESARGAEERAILACGPLPVEERRARQFTGYARFIGPLLPGQRRELVQVVELVQVELDGAQHHRAKAAADALEAELRTGRDHWLRRSVKIQALERRGSGVRTVKVPAHRRVVSGVVTSELPASAEALSLTSQQSAKRCRKSHLYIDCGCGSQLIPRGCGSSDCVDCTEEVAARRARRVAERVEKGLAGQGPVHRVILTLPPAVRERYLDPAKWRELGRAAAAILRAAPLRLRFLVEASHPVGDSAPEDFHPHFNFVGVQVPGARFYLSESDINTLRALWADALDLPATEVNPPEVSFYWPRRRPREAKEFRFALRYTLRPFPGWAAWLPSVRWFGAYPRGMSFESFCPHCGAAYTIRAAGANAIKLALKELHASGLDSMGLRLTGPPLVLEATPDEPGMYG